MRYGPEIVGVLAQALSKRLEGASIQRVDGGKDWTILKTGKDGLFISWSQDNFGASLTGESSSIAKSLGAVRGGISLALSKYIVGAKIKRVYQRDQDRIMCVEFYRYVGAGIGSKTTLVAEFMGRLSNLILIDEDERIIESARHVHPDVNRYRTILPGIVYQTPPPLEGISITSVSIKNIERYLKSPIGIGKVLASRVDREMSEGFVSKEEIVSGMDMIVSGDESLLLQDIGGYISLWPWILPEAIEIPKNIMTVVQDHILESSKNRKRDDLIKKGVKAIRKEIKGLCRHIDGLKNQLKMAEEANTLKEKGEAILSNIKKIPSRSKSVNLIHWDSEGKEMTLHVDLDPSLDPSQNARKYFKKYKKYSCDKDIVSKKLFDLELILEAQMTQIETIELIEDIQVLRDLVSESSTNKVKVDRKKTSEPAHLTYQFGEALFLVGLSEKSNRFVTFKSAGPNDIWFHVHEAPGSHVIMKNPPNDPQLLELGIKIGASLALHYSKNAGKEHRPVDYTYKKHVRHIQGAGPAQVTYKESKSISIDHLFWKEALSGTK
ncbi:MAG: NFACT family protein [Dethiosulfovibrio sp.]|nr:NFACT family protein [Dethiosulfovibrio sp.]